MKKRKKPARVRREITMSVNLPVSVTMIVEAEDDDLETTTWTPVEIIRAHASDVHVRDVCENTDDGERDYLDELARTFFEWDQCKVYMRDASFHPRSKPGGKMPVYHFPDPRDGAECMAACSSRIMLLETSECDPGELLPGESLCGKPACRKRRPAAR